MRFRLMLAVVGKSTKDALIPINYQYELSSWIFHTINSFDNKFAQWLHNKGTVWDFGVVR